MTGRDEYSVCVFFPDGTSDYICRFVSPLEVVRTFRRQTETVGARMGTSQRVIVTDGGDCICMEWKYGEGFTFPPELVEITNPKQEH